MSTTKNEPRNPAVLSSAELERLAVAAGFKVFNGKIVACDEGSSGLATESLTRFAELVAKAECEACARYCDHFINRAWAPFDKRACEIVARLAALMRARFNTQTLRSENV